MNRRGWALGLMRWLAGRRAEEVLGDLEEVHRARVVRRGRVVAFVVTTLDALDVSFALLRRRLGERTAVSWLDVRLSLRMLVKYPGLTLVTVFALALGIPGSLAPLHFFRLFEAPLPFREGERIVGLRHRSPGAFQLAGITLHEFDVWRQTLTGFEAVGAARSERYNVVADDGRALVSRGSRITASAFDVVRVAPLLGRPLVPADETLGAPDVIVISHEVWRSLFDEDPAVLARSVRIGGAPHRVVGVMPEGFRFPYIDRVWLPLRRIELAAPGQGPAVWGFGRLAQGVSEEWALAELRGVHAGLSASFPEAYASQRPEIVPFAFLISASPLEMRWGFAAMQLFAFLLLAVACGNVGTLILARTAARSAEIAVRTALGASRARIVWQLFVESLTMALLSTGLGLLLGRWAAVRVGRLFGDGLPFWFDFGLTPVTVMQALAVAACCAAVAGVLPVLRATRGNVHATIQRTASGGSGVVFGRLAAGLVVTEVALGVVCLFLGVVVYRVTRWNDVRPMEIAGEERILTAELDLAAPALETWSAQRSEAEEREWLSSVQNEVVRRMGSEVGVEGVALTRFLPREGHGTARMEVEGEAQDPARGGHLVVRGWVGLGFFGTLGHPVTRGRDFAASDLVDEGAGGRPVIIVNRTFVERVLHGGNAIGRRVRYVPRDGEEPGPWLEIVGVVGSLGLIDGDAVADDAGFYHPMANGAWNPVEVVARVAGDPALLAPRLGQLAAGVDPGAMIRDARPLSEIRWGDREEMRWTALALGGVAAIAVVLSIACLYALMAFTVAQRTKEIGLRTALGAHAADIVAVIARRALAQLGVGVALGSAAVAGVIRLTVPEASFTAMEAWPLLLMGVAGVVILLGMGACIVPAMRGIRIRPMDAMRV